MTPKRLRLLWRERWGKVDVTAEANTYASGAISNWCERISSSAAWSLPGMGVLAAILFTGLTLLLVSVRFSVADQWWLTCFVLTISLFIRFLQPPMMTMLLLCFAIISTSRYLYWRFDDTLGPAFTIDFFLALGLWVIEVYGAILFALGIVQALWPAKQAPMALPDDLNEWPTVGIFVLGAGRSAEDIGYSLSSLQETRWPRSKLSFTVVDAFVRDALQTSLIERKINYLAYPDETHGAPGLLNQALAQTNADLVVILMAGQAPSVDFLIQNVGWFHRDASLGMLCTLKHFLVPAPPTFPIERFAANGSQAEIFITRVSLCLESGGIPVEAPSTGMSLARNLQSKGFEHAVLIEQEGEKWCIPRPFIGHSTRWKLRVERAHEVLGFYKPLLGFTLLTVSLPYLLAGIELIKAPPTLWIAYALAHLAQAYLLHGRVRSTQRLPLWLEIREGFQSVYLLFLTFFTVIWTEIQLRRIATKISQEMDETSVIRITRSDHLLTFLHGTAIATGIVNLLQGDRTDVRTMGFFLAWSGFIILLLAAKLAVTKEVQQVARQKHLLRTIPAMVRLPNNRTVSCQTSNFPATQLELTVPTNLQLVVGQDLKLSLFHQMEEFAFTANVCSITDTNLTMQVDAAFHDQYARFSQAVFARGRDWPGWLPGQHVDRIIPQWLVKIGSWLLNLFAQLIHRFDRKPTAIAAENTRMKWKKKA